MATFSRRHYEAIAEAIAKAPILLTFREGKQKTAIVMMLAGLFERDNPRFDAERFYKACNENP
jgi:hypothetical protein